MFNSTFGKDAPLRRHSLKLAGALALVMASGTPFDAQAQTAAIYGQLGNFDVANLTGQDACGFEVEVQGAQTGDIGGGFGVNRYGNPTITPGLTAAGTAAAFARWKTPAFNPDNTCQQRTVPHSPSTSFGGTCYQWNGASYDLAGCEHFGVWIVGPGAFKTMSRWLVPDAANPGTLVAVNPGVPVAQPYYAVLPPVVPNNPPQVEIVVEAPEPAERPDLYGDAQWMRIFVTQYPTVVTLDQLVTDNPIVPQDPTKLESNYQIVQDEPAAGGNGKRKRHRYQGGIDPTTRTVVRRIELYRFTGQYDPITHEALCADGLCNVPAANELGELISAQMTAVLVQSDSLTVAKTGTGKGDVSSSDKLIACGTKCVVAYNAGTQVTLTPKAASGSVFAGWTGACTGTAATCTVSVFNHTDVGAVFNTAPVVVGGGGGAGGGGGGGAGGGGGGGTTSTTFTLQVGANSTGAVTSDVGGISCGKTCSTKLASGAVVTLTATPAAGKTFLGWSGACAGTASTCTLTMSTNRSVNASFSK